LAENTSFDVLIDEIRPSVFAVGDDNQKREGKEREGKGRYTKSEDVILLGLGKSGYFF